MKKSTAARFKTPFRTRHALLPPPRLDELQDAATRLRRVHAPATTFMPRLIRGDRCPTPSDLFKHATFSTVFLVWSWFVLQRQVLPLFTGRALRRGRATPACLRWFPTCPTPRLQPHSYYLYYLPVTLFLPVTPYLRVISPRTRCIPFELRRRTTVCGRITARLRATRFIPSLCSSFLLYVVSSHLGFIWFSCKSPSVVSISSLTTHTHTFTHNTHIRWFTLPWTACAWKEEGHMNVRSCQPWFKPQLLTRSGCTWSPAVCLPL